MPEENNFTFAISLSVLNHLGRNLYRSFITVLGEAVSNAWDADAENVWIYIDRENNNFFIKDDGIGMTRADFQNKFLKIGYSKRKEGDNKSKKERPYIGRKGIGKLALLSCAEKITVISKTEDTEYIGGTIDNTGLDAAIEDDLTPDNYSLEDYDTNIFTEFTNEHEHGTIIFFESIKEGIKNSLPMLRKSIALYFRFSLLDENFNIFLNDKKITFDDIIDLVNNTQFLWIINDSRDPFIQKLQEIFTEEKNEVKQLNIDMNISGFVASVNKPRDLKVFTVDERVSVDLFVNGRLRERDILKHIATSRVVENYLYGQIHFDELDDTLDRFTSSRESIVADDPKFKELLDFLKVALIPIILQDWDTWRRKHRNQGDSDNLSISMRDRKAEELFNEVSKEYSPPVDSEEKRKVEGWVSELSSDATFNFSSYAECFISENLIRKYIKGKNITLATPASTEITNKKRREQENKSDGNVNIDLRQNNDDLSYLDMKLLTKVADVSGTQNTLQNDAKEYKPIRDALMHTALLTLEAKTRLTTVYDNIKARVRNLLFGNT